MSKLAKIRRKGNYGFICGVRFGNVVLAGRKRTPENEEIYFLNKRIFKLKLFFRFAHAKILNQPFSLHNASLIKSLFFFFEDENKRILFVVEDLEEVGGLETRLTNQLACLSSHGWKPMLLHMGMNQCYSLQKYPNFMLKFDALDFMAKLLEIVRLSKTMIVEFEFKEGNPPAYFYDIDLAALGQLSRLGCCMHGKDMLNDKNSLNGLDYCLTPHKYKVQPGINYMPNWVDANEHVWSFSHQKMALFVSRIDDEKLPTLINFVRLCKKYGIDYHIAGSIRQTDKVKEFLLKEGISERALLGPVNTLAFLKKHTERYLFVGGVGQVPLEAGGLGYPALVLTHRDNMELSTFLTKETFSFLRDWNFVIRQCPLDPCLGNVDTFFEKVRQNEVSAYQMHHHIVKECSTDRALQNYLTMLENIIPNQSSR